MLHEHHLTVERTVRYFTIEPAEGVPREVWFVCHGYGQLAQRFLRTFEALDDGRRLILAPEALSRFYLHGEGQPAAAARTGGRRATRGPAAGARSGGRREGRLHVGATWMTREERLSEIADYVAYLDALARHTFRRCERTAVQLRVLGFSQGAATAARWAAQGTTAVDQLILWGAYLPAELDLAQGGGSLSRLPVLLVWGEKDCYFDRAMVADDEARSNSRIAPTRPTGPRPAPRPWTRSSSSPGSSPTSPIRVR